MYRTRPFMLVVGAALVLLSIYTFFSLSSSPDPQVLNSPIATKPEHESTASHEVPATEGHAGNLHKTTASPSANPISQPTASPNSIDGLMKEADERFQEILSRETHSLKDAAAAYRKHRGRHPPPGFDHWYQYAKENDALIVEDFWDQIYHDLNPFWAIEPKMIRTQARRLGMGVEIKGGKMVKAADWFWHEIWGRMIATIAEYLPDMFVAMNPMDESRLLVKWERMNEYMTKVNEEKAIIEPEKVIKEVKGWEFEGTDPDVEAPDEAWNGFNPYNYARRACSPHSPARQVSGLLSPDEILAYRTVPNPNIDVTPYFDGRFVSNYTEASDFCSDASIGGLHGALMMPLTCKNSDVLMPMFGGSKFHVNNEILLPAPMYWNDEERFGGDRADVTPWNQKKDTSVWRGTATGGRSKPFTWYMFHRHRFVAMSNGTRYSHANKAGHDVIYNEFLRETAIKTLRPEVQSNLGPWLQMIHDVAFTDLVCDENEPDGSCWYIKDEFDQVGPMQFNENFVAKFLPDIDGNSFSGRYRAFLLSNSLPIKATIYREWHDSRLMAWKHFVPMNNRFSDYYRILEYFMGDVRRGIAGRDDQAEKLALEGRLWGAKVLRKVDMQIYVLRLLLEYGRLTDDNRLNIGWVDDLIGPHSSSGSASHSSQKFEEPGA